MNPFDPVVPTVEQAAKIKTLRDAYHDVLVTLFDNAHPSRERSLAQTKLEESCMWATRAALVGDAPKAVRS